MLKLGMFYLMSFMALNLDANVSIYINATVMTAPTFISALIGMIKIAFKIVWARRERSNHDFPRDDKKS